MSWTAIVPLKMGAQRKSRLAPMLSFDERRKLSDDMAEQVIAQLKYVAGIDDIILLSPHDMPSWDVHHVVDQGRGLNAELKALTNNLMGGVLVIHGDLPIIRAQDIDAIIDSAAVYGSALAPDRHQKGTNAIALSHVPKSFHFAFGPDSFARHCTRLAGEPQIIAIEGLASDLDTPEDLEWAVSQGFQFSNLADT